MATKKYTVEELNAMPLSKLLRLAVKDMETLKKRKNIVLDMNDWVRDEGGGKCAVCMAGAVLYNRCGVRDFSYDTSLPDIPDFAEAVNDMRQGELPWAAPDGRLIDCETQDDFNAIVEKTVRYRGKAGYYATAKTYLKAADYLESRGF